MWRFGNPENDIPSILIDGKFWSPLDISVDFSTDAIFLPILVSSLSV